MKKYQNIDTSIKTYLRLIFFPILALVIISCDNEPELMKWEIVSVTPDSEIDVAVNVAPTGNNYFNATGIFIRAWYKAGDVVLRCTNYDISFPDIELLADNLIYANPEANFQLIAVDKNTIKFVFAPDASGKLPESDKISLTNANGKGTLNSIIFIERTFGEAQPSE